MTKIPLLKLMLFIAAGVGFPYVFSIDEKISGSLLIITSIWLIHLFKMKRFYFSGYVLALIVVGVHLGCVTKECYFQSYHNQKKSRINAVIQGSVIQILSTSDLYTKVLVSNEVRTCGFRKFHCLSVLTIPKSSIPVALQSGNEIYCVANLHLPQPKLIPTEFSEQQYCTSLGAKLVGFVYQNEIAVINPSTNLNNSVDSYKAGIRLVIDSLYSNQHKGFLTALLIGDKSELDIQTTEQFSQTGTAHILSVSGLHVGLIAFIIYVFTGFIEKQFLRTMFCTFLIIMFIIISGLQPAAVRAGIMAILVMILRVYQREVYMVNILMFTTLIMVLLQPQIIFSIGFQLSILSLVSILYFYKPVLNTISLVIVSNANILNFIKNSIAISISASILVAPIVSYYFSIYSFISPISNIIIIPLTSMAMILSIVSYVLLPISSFLAQGYAIITSFIVEVIIIINTFFAKIPHSFTFDSNFLVLSIIISLCLVYIVVSTNLRMLLLRSTTSSIVLLVVFLISPHEVYNYNITRRNIQLTANQLHSNSTVIIVRDIKASRSNYVDKAIVDYIRLCPSDTIWLLSKGNNSKNICDSVCAQSRNKILHNLHL